ncbi:MAG: hypothetical protein WC670_18310 [Pseudolabrys sp.]|jgi:hypothetical protein
MSDAGTLLQRLILNAEAAISMRPVDELAQIEALCNDLLTWFDRPADGERVVHRYTIQMAEALACAVYARRQGRAHAEPIWFRIIGVILPDVRADFGKAIEQRKRPTA